MNIKKLLNIFLLILSLFLSYIIGVEKGREQYQTELESVCITNGETDDKEIKNIKR